MPLLIIYLAGLIAAALLWRRAPLAAMLAMISMILMLLATMGMTLIQAYLIQNRAAAGLATSFVVLSSTGSLLRATAVALRLIAVFTGRQRQMSGFEIPLAARAAQ